MHGDFAPPDWPRQQSVSEDYQPIQNDRKLVAEFAGIVVGVFVALAAESWWSERKERRYEREIREDMIVEFESNVRILDADTAENEQAGELIGMLDGSTDDALFKLADADLSERLEPYFMWAGFDPEMGSVQAFVESGNIGAISDRELRLLLARRAGLLEKRRRVNIQAVDFQHREVLPVDAEASSDQVWSDSERREIRKLFNYLFVLHGFVRQNQQELRSAAVDILTFLRDEN